MAGKVRPAHVDLAMEPVPVQAASDQRPNRRTSPSTSPLRHDRGGHAKRLLRTGRMVSIWAQTSPPSARPIKPLQALAARAPQGRRAIVCSLGQPGPIS